MFPSMPLEELGQTVVCNLKDGLVCRNKDQKPGGRPFPMPYCLNYEINVQCCVQTCSSTTTFTTTTTTETSTPTPETTPTPSTPTPTTTSTQTTTPTPETTPTPSTPTPTTTTTQTTTPTPTTTTTTQTITPTPETSTLPPSTPTPTTTTQTTTPTSTTTTPTPPTTTPTATTTETPTPTPTTTTQTTTPTPTTTIPIPPTTTPTATATETPTPTPTTTTPTPSTTVSPTTTPSTTTPTTTTIETRTPTPKTITTATESPTTTLSPTTSTTPSPTPCFLECEWTGWLDSGKPDYDKEGGDVESIEGVCAPGRKVNDTSCRAAMFPSMPLEELGQTVVCNADVGLVCRNKDQKPGGRPFPMPYCLNYEINVQCCDLICSSTTTFTTTTTTTTPTSEITTTATESATTTPSPTTSTTPSTTPCFPECKWTGWLDSGKPDYDKEGGDVESIEGVCAPGWVVNDTSCRAAMFPSMPLEELGQTVTCNESVGLVCRNKDQKPGGRPFPMPYCLNYEINVQCCVQTCSSTTFTTTTTTETTTPTPETTTTQTTTPTPETTPTPPTPTPTTTTTTTQTTTPTPGTSTPTPSPPTSTTTTTQTTTPIPGTTTSIPSTSTPSTTVSPTPTPTTMTTTTTTEIPPPPSTTTESPTITPSTTTTTTSTTTTETSTPTSPVTQTPTITTTTTTTTTPAPTTTESPTTTPSTTTTTESSTAAPSPTPTNTQPGSSTLPTPPSTPTPPTAPSTPTGSTLSTSTAPPGTSTSGTTPTPATVPTTTRGTPTQTRPPTTPSTLETTSTSSTVTPISSPTTVFNTSLGTVSSSTLVICCVVNDTNKLIYYAPGEEVYSGRHGDTCYYVNCSVECTLQTFNWSCPSSPSPTSTPSPSTPSSPATTTSTSTSTPTPFPPTTTTTPSPTTTTPSPSTPPSPPTTTTSTTSSPPTTTPSPTTSTPSPPTPPSTAKTTSTTTSKPTTTKPPGCQNLNPPREDNESWWLCNCTKAVCREDGTLEIVEVECEPPPMPTCSNGLKPVRVLDPDGCCWHWECDCLCTGWGDPHYVTFDGLYYSYQGNCTYVLVEEVVPTVDNFGVYIDNYHCDVNDKVSCPRTLIVRHETQEVQIRTVQMLPIKVQVQVNRQMVALPYRKFGMQVYESGINIVVDIPELGVVVSYNGLAFSVQLPYRLFGNNTKGQCGTCTNNTADDCVLPSGEVTPNCEIAADQWVVDDPSKPHCPHGGFTTQSPAATSPRAPARPKDCTGSPVCQLIKDSLFAGCHALVPPQHYYEACLYDTCFVPDSNMECASLQAYAALCAQEGFCVDWRPHSKGACPVKCPSHREYRACGPPEEPTCQSSTPKNSTRLVEGCFCPEGTMNFAPGYDVCVKTCGCVGPDNVPREFGERFEFACQDCVCLEGGSGITCEPRQCGQAGPTSCEEEGTYLTTEVNPADTCCNVTSCKCDSSLCSKEVPVCDLGFEAKLRIVSGRCCPVYDCVPKGVCVHDKAEYQPGSPVYSSKCQDCLCTHAVDNSTQLNAISCTPVPCNVSCNPGFEAVEVPGECCRKCQQTQCIIDVPGGNYLVLKPGDVQQDPNNKCTFFSCTKFHGQLISSLSNVTCPEFDPNSCAPGTTTFMANGCCKKCTPRNQTVVPCAAVAVTREISHLGCRKNVTVNDCSGACGTFAKYSGKAKILDSRCSCCREERTSQRQVALDCPNGGSLTYTYTHIESCLCQDSICEAFGRRRRSVAGLAGGL